MQNELQFDFGKAQQLIATLESCRSKLSETSRELDAAVRGTWNWWVGSDQQAYAARFREALGDLKGYERVVDDTLNYMKKVSNGKSDLEKKGKKRFI